MSNPRPRLSVFSRQLPVMRVQAGWPAAHAAEQLGISRATACKWVLRYRTEGNAGLLDCSSRSHSSPRRTTEALRPGSSPPAPSGATASTAWARSGLRPSTVPRVLHRRGVSRLRDTDRVTAAPGRYVACHPGALLHQDHKKLGRIPDGGGHRVLGRSTDVRRRQRGSGCDHLKVVIDDASRYAVVVPVPEESGASAAYGLETAAAEFATLGIRIQRVLTDNGLAYVRSRACADVIQRVGARYKRTRPWRPQTIGNLGDTQAQWRYRSLAH